MNLVDFLMIMFLGIVAYLVVVWATFVDFVGMLMKIFPNKKPRGYDTIKKNRHSKQFQQHKIKWIKIYLSLIIIYICCYIALTVFV